eukprot:55431_1
MSHFSGVQDNFDPEWYNVDNMQLYGKECDKYENKSQLKILGDLQKQIAKSGEEISNLNQLASKLKIQPIDEEYNIAHNKYDSKSCLKINQIELDHSFVGKDEHIHSFCQQLVEDNQKQQKRITQLEKKVEIYEKFIADMFFKDRN